MIWLIGNKGMLGTQLEKAINKEGIPLITSDREVDITDPKALDTFIKGKKPEYIINCSAYTAVDKAESEAEIAHKINADGVRNIALTAKALDSVLIHISTDYVYDGLKQGPYLETDPTGPLSVYGATKLAGENYIREAWHKHYIIRISWLYGIFGANFVKTMMRLMAEKPELKVVSDQTGSPTYASLLADNLVSLVQNKPGKYGTYLYSDAGNISWYEFACAIQEEALSAGLLTKSIPIHPITAAEYPTPAKRPANSAFDKSKVIGELGFKVINWRFNLKQYIKELKAVMI